MNQLVKNYLLEIPQILRYYAKLIQKGAQTISTFKSTVKIILPQLDFVEKSFIFLLDEIRGFLPKHIIFNVKIISACVESLRGSLFTLTGQQEPRSLVSFKGETKKLSPEGRSYFSTYP